MLAIESSDLSRRFGAHIAVESVNLSVPKSAVFGFLGQNGAGKTTTIRLILGLLRPSRGTARIFGYDMLRQRIPAARQIGALVETPCHYDHLTGRENLSITQRLLDVPSSEIERVLETVDLPDAADRRVGGYSLGMRQRLGVARALIGRPRLLVLDEPTNGLDPHGILDMRELIAQLSERDGVTVLVSSHILTEVEQTATHIGLMHNGRLILQSSVADLRARQMRTVRLMASEPEKTVALLQALGLQALIADDGSVQVTSPRGELADRDVSALNARLVTEGVRVFGLEVREPTLENIFVSAIGSGGQLSPGASAVAIAA